MKKFILTMAALLSLAACSRNSGTDEPTPQPLSSILGKWKYTGSKTLNKADNTVLGNNPADDCSGKSTYEFKKDIVIREFHYMSGGTCEREDPTYTYSYDETTKVIELKESNGLVYTYTVVVDGNNLQLINEVGDKKGVFMYTKAN